MSGFFSNWTMQSFTGVIPCTGAVFSLREPFVTPLNRQLRYCPVSVCTQTLPVQSAFLLFPCALFWSAVGTSHLGIALGSLLSLFHFLHFNFPGQSVCASGPLPSDGNQGENGLAVQQGPAGSKADGAWWVVHHKHLKKNPCPLSMTLNRVFYFEKSGSRVPEAAQEHHPRPCALAATSQVDEQHPQQELCPAHVTHTPLPHLDLL